MRNDRARLLDARSHQKRRPVNSVKAKNIFADDMQSGPKFFEADRSLLLLVAKSDRGDVIRQRVEPNVHRVIGIAGNRNTPTDGRAQTTNGEILQAAGDETSDFVAARFRPHEISTRFVKI